MTNCLISWPCGCTQAPFQPPGEYRHRCAEHAEASARGCAAKIAAVEALIEHARKISPSPSMSIYVADLERALGRDAPRPHKLGGNEAAP